MRLLTALYPLFAPTARLLPPERAHRLGLLALDRAHRFGLIRPSAQLSGERTSCLGFTFRNRIGVAAGLDKDGRYIDCVGALINQMGFPNDGAAAVAARLAHRKFTGVCGVNNGKNADTPAARAADDYVECFACWRRTRTTSSSTCLRLTRQVCPRFSNRSCGRGSSNRC